MKRIYMVMGMLLLIVPTFADTETIKWYSDGNVYDTTTCQSGGDVNLPATTPTKRGYTFNGWIVALYDFSTLNTTDNGTTHNYNASGMTWSTVFDWGIITGDALCSVDFGTYAVAGTPDETTPNGQYCWCRATGYTPISSNIKYEPTVSPLSWVFYNFRGSASGCASGCADYCGIYVQGNAAFRRAVFGVTQ